VPCAVLECLHDKKALLCKQVVKYVVFLIGLFLSLWSQSLGAERLEMPRSEISRAETIPPRPKDGISGSEFARRTAGMSEADRQQAALAELRRGNVPEFLRNLKPVRLSYALCP
jgi:hypothetical protein